MGTPSPADDVAPNAAGAATPAGAPRPLAPGLHLLATPIGAARDITLRGLDALGGADVLAAEDTRTLRKLMDLHGVPLRGRPLIAYHDHNATAARPGLLARLAEGASVVYASEAGTPLIADPGLKLARAARAQGSPVTALPGPCAAIQAVLLSGADTDQFSFLGFPPPKSAARRRFLERWASAPGTLAIYEAPRRLAESLADMAAVFGDRPAAVAREMTKRHEEVRRDTLTALAAHYAEAGPPKGETVVVLDPLQPTEPDAEMLDAALLAAAETLSLRDAARTVAEQMGVGKRLAYERLLDISAGRVSRESDGDANT